MRLFGPKPPPAPRVVFDVDPDDLRCRVELPDLGRLPPGEADRAAERLAAVLTLLGGRAAALVQGAVVRAADRQGRPGFAEHALGLAAALRGRPDPDPGRPVMTPLETFAEAENG